MHEPHTTAGLAHAQTAGASTTRSARVALALIAAMVATLLGGLPSTAGAGAAPSATTEAMTRIVVQAQQDIGATAAAVAAQGGRILEVLNPFGIVVADVPADAIATIEADAATAAVTEDVPLRVQSADTTSAARATVAAGVDPDAGAGVGIVMVDTGIAEHPDLDDRVVARYDLATGKANGKSNGKAKGHEAAAFDPHGHGTFLAGLAAGSGASSDGLHAGVAPAAHLVSVRVADADGSTTLARVLHGLAVADAARTQHDAPVVLLALAGPAGDVPDPVMIVLEMLWSRGSTVVVASGNQGDEGHGVTSPGVDPYLLTVGALDDNGTADPADDSVPSWSSRGDHFGPKPDLVAPGVSVVGLRSPGSTIDTQNPTAVVDDHYFRGSGTSMAAAITAGAAAAVLADDPSLDPNGVKGRLMGSAAEAPAGTEPLAAGDGVLDLATALESDAGPANTALPALPEATNPDRAHGRVTAPGQLARTADGLEPAAWSWTAWSWTAWSWTAWSWTGWEWTAPADTEGDWAAWSWTDGEWTAWSWTEQDWTAWSWTEQDWSAWSWTAWSWTAWSWTAQGWGEPGV